MTGGLMNIISYGTENVILQGNPKKTFFKATYAKHTNFGMQKFRLEQTKQQTLKYDSEQVFEFKLDRIADLISDTYIGINIPTIYSQFYVHKEGINKEYYPYEFQWIKNLGTHMIKEIQITSAGSTLAKYSGEYIQCVNHRDRDLTKQTIFNKMTGNTNDLYDPANSNYNNGFYPTSSSYEHNNDNPIPSIYGRTLYIPLESWFTQSPKTALPIIAVQYQEIYITITFRAIKELYTIKNIKPTNLDDLQTEDVSNNRLGPNQTEPHHHFKWFPRKPHVYDLSQNPQSSNPNGYNYSKPLLSHNWDVHLLATYIFLQENERQKIASKSQSYLIKKVVEHEFFKVSGSRSTNVDSRSCVSNYMFRLRRDDVTKRNEWSNYTNWEFENVRPKTLTDFSQNSITWFKQTGDLSNNHTIMNKNILRDLALKIDGEYRENKFDVEAFSLIEKYARTSGPVKDGLYHYNFCLNSQLKDYQPSGSMNMTKYGRITFELNTITPPFNPKGIVQDYICNGAGEIIGIRKVVEDLNAYNFDLKVFEERYNVINIIGGNINLLYAD
jgi:hypothetical protein